MELITSKMCKTSDIGVNGNLFGGTMLALLDEAGAIYAAQICDTSNVITKKMDEVVFDSPIKVGNIFKIYGEVVKFGNTSINLKLEARKHNVMTGKQTKVCSTEITFVRIDEDGSPVPISSRVKSRYYDRFEKYGRGLLSQDEINKASISELI